MDGKKSDESMNGPDGDQRMNLNKSFILDLAIVLAYLPPWLPRHNYILVPVNGGVFVDRVFGRRVCCAPYTFIAFDDNINFAFHSIRCMCACVCVCVGSCRCQGFVSLFI